MIARIKKKFSSQSIHLIRHYRRFSIKSSSIMAEAFVTTNDTSIDDEYVKSRMENGRYINSFNPKFKMPGYATILRWMVGAPNNTNLPADIQELNRLLPVHKPDAKEIAKPSSSIRFVWIGHATCLVQMEGFMFITDPVFGDRCGVTPKVGPKRYRPPALTVDELPDELEAVLISHSHFDHLDYPSVKSLDARYGKKLKWFCGQGGRQWFVNIGIENVVELDWWEEWKHPDNKHVQIAFCPAQHWSRRTLFDLNKSLWGGYAVWSGKHRFYFAGDTGYTDEIPIFRQIGKKYGPFDLSAIPIGAYEPRWMMEGQHVAPLEAVQMHVDTQSKKSIGIHWGTWALANEFYIEPKEKLLAEVKEKNLDPDSFIVVQHGEIFNLPENN